MFINGYNGYFLSPITRMVSASHHLQGKGTTLGCRDYGIDGAYEIWESCQKPSSRALFRVLSGTPPMLMKKYLSNNVHNIPWSLFLMVLYMLIISDKLIRCFYMLAITISGPNYPESPCKDPIFP